MEGKDNTKPLVTSMTFITIMAMMFFNLIDEERFTFVYGYIDEIVNSLLTFVAVYGRYRASHKIKGVV